jgi:uncharacterized protein with FMN-binding domain
MTLYLPNVAICAAFLALAIAGSTDASEPSPGGQTSQIASPPNGKPPASTQPASTATSRPDGQVGHTNAVATSRPDGKYADGVYTGGAKAYKGQIELKVTISSSRIVTIDVVTRSNDARWNKAVVVLDRVIKHQGTAGVDTISGATFTSRALLKAAKEALDKADKKKLQPR